MELRIKDYVTGALTKVSGAEARAKLKEVLHLIGQNIMIAEPPYTGIVRRRAIERLKAGDFIWTDADPRTGQPRGTILQLTPTVIGVIGEDGVYKGITEEGKALEGTIDVQTDKD